MFLYLQTTKHVRFCCCDFIKYSGIIPIVAGAVLSTWAFLILGTDRSSQVNFFVENVPVVKRSVYKYLLGKQAKPQLTHALRQSFFSQGFMSAAINDLPLTLLVQENMTNQSGMAAGGEVQAALLKTIQGL